MKVTPAARPSILMPHAGHRSAAASKFSGHPVPLAVIGIVLCVGALLLQLLGEETLLTQIILGGGSSLFAIFFLLARAAQDGTRISLLAYAIFFLNLFYTVRGLSFLVVGDDDLALRVGVGEPALVFGQAMAWFNGFLGLFLLGAFVERKLRLRSRPAMPVGFLQNPRLARHGLLVFGAGCLYLLGTFVVSKYVGIFGFFALVIPFGFGVCLAGMARWITPQQKSGLIFRYVIAFFLALVVVYLTRGQFTSRMFSVGILALLAGLIVAQTKLGWLGILGLIVVLPFVQSLGESRHVSVGQASGAAIGLTANKLAQGPVLFVLEPYTADSGDFTALDIFASVLAGEQNFRPWGLSFVYMFVHWVPRQVWPDKPEAGILTDEDSFRMARLEFSDEAVLIPYDPGIVGTFYLEGAELFVVIGAVLLGYAISFWDRRIGESLRRDPSKIHAYALFSMAIFVIFFTARFRPYQIFYLLVSLHAGYFAGLAMLRKLAR